jgi:hypothetical protein
MGLLAIAATACTQSVEEPGDAGAPPVVTHITANYDASYDSIFVLRADAKVAVIQLTGGVHSVPRAASLAFIRARMYPTTGVVYPSNTEEWFCPGP